MEKVYPLRLELTASSVKMTIPAGARFLLLLLLILVPVLKAAPTDLPTGGNDPHANPSRLQRREIICNPEPNQNLNWHDCHTALLQVPGEFGIKTPLSGTDPGSPHYLPRQFTHNGCRIVVELAPEVDHSLLSWGTVRYRASVLVNWCVGGLGAWAPAVANAGLVPGRAGNETYKGVMIGVMRPWVAHNVP